MSTRLRASIRAGNKGRSLRPRAQLRPSAPPDEPKGEQEALVADSRPASADPRATETVREPAAARGSEDSDSGEDGDEPLVVSQTSPSVISPVALAKAEPKVEVASTASQVPAAAGSFKGEASSSEDESEDDEEVVQAAPPAEVAKKAEPAPAPVLKKAEEPKKVEAAPAKKAEPAPAPVAAKKAEPTPAPAPPKKAEPAPAPVAAKKAEEPKKVDAAPAKKAEPAPTPVAAKKAEPAPAPVAAKKAEPAPVAKKVDDPKRKGGKPEMRLEEKKNDKRAVDDVEDPSSISAEFFRREVDSLPPLVDAHEDHEHEHVVPVQFSPAVIARRARLQRVVAGVVAFAGVITLAVVGKTLAAGKTPSAPMKPPVVQEAKQEPKPEPKEEPKPAPAPVPAKTEEAKAVEPPVPSAVPSAEPSAVPSADAKAAPSADAKAEEPKKAEPSGGDAKALTKEAESLLNRGNRKDAMAKAREAIAADPNEAMPYLLLGSALQDSGKWKDGIEAYSECVRNATKGPVNECRAMGGHK